MCIQSSYTTVYHHTLDRSSAPTIYDVVTALKKFTNRDCKHNLWQRGYMDHIIRNQSDFERHWEYIEYNALKEYPLKEEKI